MTMTDLTNGKGLLLGSLAVNIFLSAFILGRVSLHEPAPPPPPPPFAMEGRGHDDGPMHGMRRPGGRMMPFFGAGELFTKEEMKAGFERMHENFGKIREMREDFAKKLEKGPVSREQALEHFAAIDKIMSEAKREMQTKAADKISHLNDEQRARFARRLQEHSGPGGDVPPPPSESD